MKAKDIELTVIYPRFALFDVSEVKGTEVKILGVVCVLSLIYSYVTVCRFCADSAVGIATRYGLDGPGIESRWGRDFPHPSRPALGPTQPPCTMGTGSFQKLKRPGRGADHPPPI